MAGVPVPPSSERPGPAPVSDGEGRRRATTSRRSVLTTGPGGLAAESAGATSGVRCAVPLLSGVPPSNGAVGSGGGESMAGGTGAGTPSGSCAEGRSASGAPRPRRRCSTGGSGDRPPAPGTAPSPPAATGPAATGPAGTGPAGTGPAGTGTDATGSGENGASAAGSDEAGMAPASALAGSTVRTSASSPRTGASGTDTGDGAVGSAGGASVVPVRWTGTFGDPRGSDLVAAGPAATGISTVRRERCSSVTGGAEVNTGASGAGWTTSGPAVRAGSLSAVGASAAACTGEPAQVFARRGARDAGGVTQRRSPAGRRCTGTAAGDARPDTRPAGASGLIS